MASLDENNLETNLNAEGIFDPGHQYSVSKLAQIVYSNELARQLKDDMVESVALHPGNNAYLVPW